MFSEAELNIDSNYFEIINRNYYVVTIRSKNTGHYWHIVNSDETNYRRTCYIYHKHKTEDQYHYHGCHRTLDICLKSIYCHDSQVIRRKKENKKRGRPTKSLQ